MPPDAPVTATTRGWLLMVSWSPHRADPDPAIVGRPTS